MYKYVIELKTNGEIIKKSVRNDYKLTLGYLQRAVGGYIETVGVTGDFAGRKILLIVNEEGVIRGLEFNAHATSLVDYPIFGNCVVVRADGEELLPLEEEDVQNLYKTMI